MEKVVGFKWFVCFLGIGLSTLQAGGGEGAPAAFPEPKKTPTDSEKKAPGGAKAEEPPIHAAIYELTDSPNGYVFWNHAEGNLFTKLSFIKGHLHANSDGKVFLVQLNGKPIPEEEVHIHPEEKLPYMYYHINGEKDGGTNGFPTFYIKGTVVVHEGRTMFFPSQFFPRTVPSHQSAAESHGYQMTREMQVPAHDLNEALHLPPAVEEPWGYADWTKKVREVHDEVRQAIASAPVRGWLGKMLQQHGDKIAAVVTAVSSNKTSSPRDGEWPKDLPWTTIDWGE